MLRFGLRHIDNQHFLEISIQFCNKSFVFDFSSFGGSITKKTRFDTWNAFFYVGRGSKPRRKPLALSVNPLKKLDRKISNKTNKKLDRKIRNKKWGNEKAKMLNFIILTLMLNFITTDRKIEKMTKVEKRE